MGQFPFMRRARLKNTSNESQDSRNAVHPTSAVFNLTEIISHQTCLLDTGVQLAPSHLHFFALLLPALRLLFRDIRIDVHHPFVPHLPLVGLPPHMHHNFAIIGNVDWRL